ncbi:MAG: histidine kinase dimerization/phospho-acceptor domain-containing protein [Phycisphaerae bacterium]
MIPAPHSLRARLLLGATLTMVIVLTLLGIAVDASVHRTLSAEFNAALLAKVQAIASFVEQHEHRIVFEFDPSRTPEFQPGPHAAFFELWVDGKRIHISPSLEEFQSLPHAGLSGDETQYADIRLPDGRRGRLVAFPFTPYLDEDAAPSSPQSQGVLYAAMQTTDLDRTLDSLRFTIAALCLAAIVICGATLLLVVSRATHPLRAVARKIESLHETDLSARVHVAGLPAELRPTIDRLNALLDRLESAFSRERAFTADVAHELRTPIAGLRTTLEVCRSRPRDPAVYAAAIDRSLKVIHSMQTVIENLLLLARADSGQLPLSLTQTDLPALIRDAWSAFAPRAADANLSVRFNLPDTCILPLDAPKLRIVLTNLFDNALSYTEPGGAIEIELLPAATCTQFRISNTVGGATQLAPHELPRLFERFWRKDASRSQTGLHAGLGLSLCQRLLALSNIPITPTLDAHRFTLSLTLPQPVTLPQPA